MRHANQSVVFPIASDEKAFRWLAVLPEGGCQDIPARNLSGLFVAIGSNAEHSCGGFAAEQKFLPQQVLQQNPFNDVEQIRSARPLRQARP